MAKSTNSPEIKVLLRDYETDGYVVVRQVFTRSEAGRMASLIKAELDAFEQGAREGDPRYVFARTNHILEISNLFNIVSEFADLSVHRRLAVIAGQLIRADRLRIYHDALLHKKKRHAHVPWHQDGYFSVVDGRTITAWMPLIDVVEEGGALVYAPGSHEHPILNRSAIGEDADVESFLVDSGYKKVSPGLRLGDVIFHSPTVFHRSERLSDGYRDRMAFSVFFFEDGARLRVPEFGREDLVDSIYFPRLGVGDIAKSALNPLVL